MVGTVSATLAMLLGFGWWQVFVIYVGAGIIGLVVAAIALAVTPDDELGHQEEPAKTSAQPSRISSSHSSSLAGFGASNHAMLTQDMRSGGETMFERRPNAEQPGGARPNPVSSVSKL